MNKDEEFARLLITSGLITNIQLSPVCLPPVGYHVNSATCIITGWGRTSNGKETESEEARLRQELWD